MASPDFGGCPVEAGPLVEKEIDRIRTQYRESDRLLAVLRADLEQVAEVMQVMCAIPEAFDIETAVGEQLTFLGRRMGWPRSHCYCTTHPVFGFDCGDEQSSLQIEGFCVEGIRWSDCIDFGVGTVTIDDDELYRKFLKVRRYQYLALFDIDSLTACARTLFGDQALVIDSGNRRVVIAPGRALTKLEASMLPLFRRVLPIALGIDLYFHFGTLKPFGFGEGWGGFCDVEVEYVISTEDGSPIETEDGAPLSSGVVAQDPDWLCPVKIEDCMNIEGLYSNG